MNPLLDDSIKKESRRYYNKTIAGIQDIIHQTLMIQFQINLINGEL